MKEFAERLKDLRVSRELTLVDVVNQTGINIASLSRWENAKADIRGEHIKILSKFYGVTAGYLLGIED